MTVITTRAPTADPFDAALAFTLSQEKLWSDNPADPGGCTMRGVTLAVYRAWLHEPNATPEMLRAISENEVSALYRALYWNPIAGHSLPPGLGLSVFDSGVNVSVRESAMQLQRVLEVDVDGAIGPQTVLAARGADPTGVLIRLASVQLAYYERLTGWTTFGNGWRNRVHARLAAARNALVHAF